jgi:hypothetical protein
MPLSLYPQGKSPWYPLDRRLGEPQSRSGRGEEKKSHPRRESNPRTPIVQFCYVKRLVTSILHGKVIVKHMLGMKYTGHKCLAQVNEPKIKMSLHNTQWIQRFLGVSE